ncbi:class I mannose-6-phosphate isomerase [Millionella massiliensis]|uniref:class I mannose-6-phosphate isomerase n=1 Tax=Millionella massiliensis TaxID=1871023 RepID=UPI0008DAFF5F|nr:class I mannose-6-phosphate isomerase [Millionella massiliensis]
MQTNRESNYDKYPATRLDATLWKGWAAIRDEISRKIQSLHRERCVVAIECYQGVYHEELEPELKALEPIRWFNTAELFKPVEEIERMTYPYVTDDRLFGFRARFTYADFLVGERVEALRSQLREASGVSIVYGHGAAYVAPDADLILYVDMARWEIQQRSRRHEVCGLGVENRDEGASYHYKRGYFVDWIVCDGLKKTLLPKADYWLDTHQSGQPKMITGDTLRSGLDKTAHQPFRVVPFFDPAPWGGQWMKSVCGLDPEPDNYGWCFDCVPEENSLYFDLGGVLFEMPANNLVFYRTRELLGGPVESRFGQDFPIRFDFLDTMGGGNLSLQVHPTTQYIRDTFGIYYTQDESYYLLDAEPGATVFLGLKTGVDPQEMIGALNESQQTGRPFDAEKYVNRWPARKHDHFLIPNGTIHCSGAGAMVLEISATPSIFTFKLWDWGRLGLDGLPRPINIGHGSHVIQWERQTEFTRNQLVNQVTPVAEGEGWREERTGLHENEFIETRRHWFTAPVEHHTDGGVNVFNLVEGDEAIVESPTGAFEPFVVHYAETFIIPASVGTYTIRPYGRSEGRQCGTIKAYVRFRN